MSKKISVRIDFFENDTDSWPSSSFVIGTVPSVSVADFLKKLPALVKNMAETMKEAGVLTPEDFEPKAGPEYQENVNTKYLPTGEHPSDACAPVNENEAAK